MSATKLFFNQAKVPRTIKGWETLNQRVKTGPEWKPSEGDACGHTNSNYKDKIIIDFFLQNKKKRIQKRYLKYFRDLQVNF